jgi:6-pyruvoyltetrahydropterin/6-carboxytetrahydropterin synthase
MFRLTREVRFAINPTPDAQLAGRPTNSHAGFPSLTGIAGRFLSLQVTLAGELNPASSYLRNIKEIDEVIRRQAIPFIESILRHQHAATPSPGFDLPARLLQQLRHAWPPTTLADIRLNLSPFLSITCRAEEHPMVRLSEKFEFSASHRLHNPALSDEENRRTYGKCNNPAGHGHNYELQITLVGTPDAHGVLVDLPAFERLVADHVIDPFDHKNLNAEVPEFHTRIPSVENIAQVIYHRLKAPLHSDRARLASITVWETPKTWCEYEE